MDDYERRAEEMRVKRHMEELNEQREMSAKNKEIRARDDMMREGYIARESASIAAEQAAKEKKDRMEKSEREAEALKQSTNAATFRNLVAMYKKDSSFSRLSRKLRGEGPNWKEIEGYGSEALDYLEAVAKGETYTQRKDAKRNADAMKKISKESGRSFSPLSEESLQAKHFNQFLRKLMMSEPALLREIEAEKKRREADIQLYGKDMSR